MSTSVALSNNQPTVYLQQFVGASAPNSPSNNSIAPNSNNINTNHSTASLVSSTSNPNLISTAASQTSKNKLISNPVFGANSTSYESPVTPTVKGGSSAVGISTTNVVTNPLSSASKPPPHSQGLLVFDINIFASY